MASFDYNNNNKKPFVRQPGFHPNDPPDKVLRGASEVGEGGSQGGCSESRGGDDGEIRVEGGIGETTAILEYDFGKPSK